MFWSRTLGVVVLAYVLLSVPPAILPRWALELGEVFGLVFLSTAAFGRLWCLVFIAGRKSSELVTDGPYSIVRNPLYVFTFMGVVGFGLAVENPILAGILAVFFAVYYPYVVRREERILAERFGDAFRDYAARTPRWIPKFGSYNEPLSVVVSTPKIRAGILDAMWFVWAFFLWELLEIIRDFHHTL